MRKVYLISSQIEGSIHYKIGYTKREVSERIKELKTGNCAEFDIVKVYKPKDFAVTIEKKLHHYFNNKKVNGEWFKLSNEDVDEFESLCESFYKLIKQLQDNNTYLQDIGHKFR